MKASMFILGGVLAGAALISCSAQEKSSSAQTAGTELKWTTSMEAAKAEAVARKVPILVDFSGSDWCGWCIRLEKEVFSQPAFKEFAKGNLVLLLVDFPRRVQQTAEVKMANRKLAEEFGVEGFPTVLLLNAEGRELARTGYKAGGAAAYVEHLKSLLGK